MSLPEVSDEGHSYIISHNYKDPDFPSVYVNFLVNDTIEYEEFILNALHRIFQSKYIKGDKYAEFGCGPTIHRLASASKTFSDITLCEFSEHNRASVERWLKKDPQATDWSALVRITARAEEYGDLQKGVKEIEDRIRSKVKRIVPCDILQKRPLPADIGQFDVLLSSYCLEGACPTIKAYKSAVKKLAGYIKPGGVLVMVVILDMTYFCMKGPKKNYKWDVLPVSQEVVQEALREAGMVKKNWYFTENNEESDGGEFTGVVVISAVKE